MISANMFNTHKVPNMTPNACTYTIRLCNTLAFAIMLITCPQTYPVLKSGLQYLQLYKMNSDWEGINKADGQMAPKFGK